jgi:hypothetical protein
MSDCVVYVIYSRRPVTHKDGALYRNRVVGKRTSYRLNCVFGCVRPVDEKLISLDYSACREVYGISKSRGTTSYGPRGAYNESKKMLDRLRQARE